MKDKFLKLISCMVLLGTAPDLDFKKWDRKGDGYFFWKKVKNNNNEIKGFMFIGKYGEDHKKTFGVFTIDLDKNFSWFSTVVFDRFLQYYKNLNHSL